MSVRAERLHRVQFELWLRPPLGVLRQRVGRRVTFEMRATDEGLITLDHVSRSMLIRADLQSDAYRLLIAHVVGPVAPLYGTDLDDLDWRVTSVKAGVRIRSRHWRADIEVATFDRMTMMPIDAWTSAGVCRWAVLSDRLGGRPPDPPRIEGWRAESVEPIGSAEAAHIAPRRLASLAPHRAVTFQSTTMPGGLQFLTWKGETHEIRVVRGVDEATAEGRDSVRLAGVQSVVTGTNPDLVASAIRILRTHAERRPRVFAIEGTGEGDLDEFIEVNQESRRDSVTESHDAWRQRMTSIVSSGFEDARGGLRVDRIHYDRRGEGGPAVT